MDSKNEQRYAVHSRVLAIDAHLEQLKEHLSKLGYDVTNLSCDEIIDLGRTEAGKAR